jgi:TetR/AcrR family transcriptional regulator, fatty acid metabolism regulator protein
MRPKAPSVAAPDYTPRTVAEAPVDKRRLLLDAATKVFAERGYHECRVGDIAAEAGVAYGLLYHYFSSKEEVLHTIFRETWTVMVDTINGIEEAGGTSRDQVRRVATVVLGAWNANPDLIRLLVREIARGSRIEQEIQEIRLAFDALERIVRRGVTSGEFRPDLHPRVASWVLYGALEEVLTGWTLSRPPETQDDVAAAVDTVVTVLCDGLVSPL